MRSGGQHGARTRADHSFASGDHASDERFSVLTATGPFTMGEQAVGDLPEARSRRAGVRGVECLESAGQLKMVADDCRLANEGANDGELLVETAIVRQVEAQGNRPLQHGALDNVESEWRAAAVD